MKELRDIVEAYEEATKAGRKTALATVVHVQGSSYRRPGARMLVREDGRLTGAISGGCLEGDALRKAQMVMIQQNPLLVLYDTSDEDDAKIGVGLGCNGIIHILIEPISASNPYNPIELIKEFLKERRAAVLVTLFALSNRKAAQPGTQLLLTETARFENEATNRRLVETVLRDAAAALANGQSTFNNYETDESYTAFIEYLKPPVSLVIAGAGNDAVPLTQMASLLGWDITVVDGRPAYVTSERFPAANKLVVCKPEKVLELVSIDEHTVFVLMTHNYNYDCKLLQLLLPLNIAYVGSLGPKKKMERMLDDLKEDGWIYDDKQLQKIYGPTGLDIGAEGAEEIALSIIAEIKMVLSAAKGGSLRLKPTAIHSNI